MPYQTASTAEKFLYVDNIVQASSSNWTSYKGILGSGSSGAVSASTGLVANPTGINRLLGYAVSQGYTGLILYGIKTWARAGQLDSTNGAFSASRVAILRDFVTKAHNVGLKVLGNIDVVRSTSNGYGTTTADMDGFIAYNNQCPNAMQRLDGLVPEDEFWNGAVTFAEYQGNLSAKRSALVSALAAPSNSTTPPAPWNNGLGNPGVGLPIYAYLGAPITQTQFQNLRTPTKCIDVFMLHVYQRRPSFGYVQTRMDALRLTTPTSGAGSEIRIMWIFSVDGDDMCTSWSGTGPTASGSPTSVSAYTGCAYAYFSRQFFSGQNESSSNTGPGSWTQVEPISGATNYGGYTKKNIDDAYNYVTATISPAPTPTQSSTTFFSWWSANGSPANINVIGATLFMYNDADDDKDKGLFGEVQNRNQAYTGQTTKTKVFHKNGSNLLILPSGPHFSVTQRQRTGSTATLTAVGHTFQVGDQVTVDFVDVNADGHIFNGTYTVTSVSGNTFSYTTYSSGTIAAGAPPTAAFCYAKSAARTSVAAGSLAITAMVFDDMLQVPTSTTTSPNVFTYRWCYISGPSGTSFTGGTTNQGGGTVSTSTSAQQAAFGKILAPANFNFTQAGTYTLRLYVSDDTMYNVGSVACGSVAGTTKYADYTVVVAASSTPPTITASGPTTFCGTGYNPATNTNITPSVTLTSSASSGNTWSTSATTQSIVVTTSGSYTVTTATGTSTPVVVTVNPAPSQLTISTSGPTTFCSGGSVTLTSSSATAAGGQSGFYRWVDTDGNAIGDNTSTLTVTTSGNYGVYTTNAAGCNSPIARVSVTVNPIPAQPSITASGPTTFCSGGSVTLTASSAGVGGTYQWSNGATTQSILVTTTGTYIVRVTSAAGCQSPASLATVVSVTPNPTIPTISASGPTTFCSGGSVTLTSSVGSTGAVPLFNKVVIVIGENTNAGSVWNISGNNAGNAPYITGLNGAKMQESYALTHPSQPNYIRLFSGATQGITDNTCPPAGAPFTTPHIGSLLIAAGKTIGHYSQGLPSVGSLVCNSGNYARKHNYISNWQGTGTNQVPSSVNMPLTSFPSNFSTLPDFSIVVPDLCDSGHDSCSPTFNQVRQYDNFVNNTLSAYANWCINNNSLLIVTYDEDANDGGPNRIATLFYGANVVPGNYLLPGFNHYDMLRTICDMFGITSYPGFAATATPITEIWTTSTGIQWNTGATTQSIVVNTSGSYFVTVTNASGCSSSSAATTVTVNPRPATPTISASGPTALCSGGSVTLTSSATTGTHLWSTGATTRSIVVSSAGTYTVTNTLNGCTSATSAGVTVTVSSSLPVSVSIAANPGTSVCAGTAVTYTATPTNGGVAPIYQWKRNGSNVGTNSTTYTLVPSNGDIITCVLTSSATCATGNPATSNALTMVVNPALPASVSIAASPGSTVCAGTAVTFTATPTNGGATPTYQWRVNGSNVGTNSSTYTTSGLVNGDVVTCVMTSNATCATGSPATSNSITMAITAAQTASVSISATASTICSGTSVTFTATPTNGGTPSYQWRVNGSNVGTNSSTYTTSGLTNGDVVTCVMTSSLSCTANNPATSNSITMTVNPVVLASVSISASASTICAGTAVTFTATPTNGGASPSYQWKNGSTNVGINSPTYTTSSLSNGDIITCVMTSNATCVTGSPATSNQVVMTVNPNVASSVSIAASATSICAGQSVTFTATPTNGGVSPSYQWKRNGSNVGTNSSTYISSSFGNGDVVTCVMTSSASCATGSPATSNSVTMTVTPLAAASVTISTASTSVCSGQTVTFTATPTNGGATPSYQWKRNGSNVGTNSATYSTSSLANGDAVTCVMTSNAACVTGSPATSNTVTMTVTTSVAASVSISATASTICAGTSVTFTATPTNGGATPSYQWKLNGSNVGTNSTTYTNSSLSDGDVVTCVMTSNATCATGSPATSNSITMAVTALPQPTVSASGPISFCSGDTVTLTAAAAPVGATYLWSNSATTQSIVVNSSGTYTVKYQKNGCDSALSAATVVSVAASQPVSVSIAANPGTTICSGQTVTFTATPTNGGTPAYQWKVNGSNVGTNSSTYTTSGLVNGDVVTCVMTSDLTCATGNPATSNSLTMTVNPNLAASVSISSTASSICAGQSVTFTATPTNGGVSPSYQWKVNGSNVGTNSSTYTTTSLVNGDVVTCVMTSNATCATGSPATSNSITMTVTVNQTASVSIASNLGSTICAGQNVTFTATPTNGGTPSYQWKVNGSNVGTNSSTYTTSGLANGDIVSCVMTSSLSCTANNPATSNSITMTVNPSAPVSLSISATSITICAGTAVTFTATPTNGGSSPVYQWKVNGANVGANINTYTTSGLSNGDVVTCQLISNAACATGNPATSNSIMMTVTPSVPASVSISATASTICSGTSVTFTATPTNGGTPSYQWKVNGSNVGTNSSTYTTSGLVNGDVVTCVMTSNATCATGSPATSNSIIMSVTTTVAASVTIASNLGSSVCSGSAVTYTATPTNGGTSPAYLWKVNGINAGTNSSTYTYSPNNGDVITCVVTSNAACVTGSPATSNSITMTVAPSVAAAVSITASSSSVCAGTPVVFSATSNGGSPTYQWKLNGSNVGTNSATYTLSSPADGDQVECVMSTSAPCITGSPATSNTITVSVTTLAQPTVSVTSSPATTEICDGETVELTASTAPVGGSYLWSTGETTQSITVSASGTYTVQHEKNGCLSTDSDPVTITVNPALPASVSISVDTNGVCGGTPQTFTAVPVNGGITPSYQWKVNGVNDGTDSDTFITGTLSDGDVVTCLMTSGLDCVSGSPALSNPITASILPTGNADISISASATTICPGEQVTFTATPTDGGTSPTYMWFKNGVSTGITADTYITTTISDGDTVSCVMTSSLSCATNNPATSNIIIMTLSPSIAAAVTITVSPNNIVNSGQNVTFNASVTNGGGSPNYEWYVSGIAQGINSPTFSTTSLLNGATVYCEVTSSLSCVTNSPATSNSIIMTVLNPSAASSFNARILPSGPTSFLAGETVDLAGLPVGPTSWQYTWTNRNGQFISNSRIITVGTSGVYNLRIFDPVANKTSSTATIEIVVKSVNDPAENRIGGATIDDKTASFAVVRANPKISGNVKITIDSAGEIWLNSFDANKELSSARYKRFPISDTSTFERDLRAFFDEGKTPPSIVFDVYEKNPNPISVANSYSDQYDFFYCAGAAPLVSSQYPEDNSYLAPLWLRDVMPDYFVIFRVPDPTDYPYNNGIVNGTIQAGKEYKVVEDSPGYKIRYGSLTLKGGDTFTGNAGSQSYIVTNGSGRVIDLDENKDFPVSASAQFRTMLKKCEVIKTFDLTENTKIGRYIRKIKNSPSFPVSPLTVRFDKELMTTWNGISYKDGVIANKGERLDDFWTAATSQVAFEQYITNGFERHGIISPALLNLEFLFTDDSTEKYTIPRYIGFYVNKLTTGTFQLDGRELYNNRNTSGNLPVPKRDNRGYRHNTESFTQNNKDGVRIYFGNEQGFIPNSETFTTFFEERLYWIQDKQGKFHSLNAQPESQQNGEYNVAKKDLVIRDKSIDLATLSGEGSVKLQAKGAYLPEKGRSYLVISINDELQPNDELRIYWSIGRSSDSEGLYDAFVANDLTGIEPSWGPGSHLSSAYFHPYGTKEEVAAAIAGAINSLEQRNFDAIRINNEVVVRMRNGGDAPNLFYCVPTVFDPAAISIHGADIDNGGRHYFEGGTDTNATRMVFPLRDREILLDGEVFAKTNLGLSKIIHVGRYVDAPIKEKGGSDLVGLEDWEDLGVFVIENPLDRVSLGHNDEFIAYDLYRVPAGLFSFFPIKEMDGDFWSSSYGRTPVREYHRYFDLLPGEECLVPYRTYLVKGSDGDSIEYDPLLPSTITVNNSTYPNGTPFVAQPGHPSFSVSSGNPIVVAKIFNNVSEVWNPLDGYFLQTTGTEVHEYTIFGSPTDYILIDGSISIPGTPNGNVFTVPLIPGTYTIDIFGTPVIMVGNAQEGSSPDKDLRSFPGFQGLKDTFSSVDTELVDRRGIVYQNREKFFYRDIQSEYDFLKENFTKEDALRSRVVPTITKWVYSGGSDVRDNPYRLNANPVFGEQNFSPSFLVKTQDPKAFTHEWYYLEGSPQQFPEKYANSNYYFFDQRLDFAWLTDADPSIRSYFDYYFTYQPSDSVGLQERYTIMKYNPEIGLSEGFFRGIKFRIKEVVRESLAKELRSDRPSFKDGSTRYDGYKFSVLLRPKKEDRSVPQAPVTISVIENKTSKSITMLIDLVVEDYRTLALSDPNDLGNSLLMYRRLLGTNTLWERVTLPGTPATYYPDNLDVHIDYTLLYSMKSKLSEKTFYDTGSSIVIGIDSAATGDIKLSSSINLSPPTGAIGSNFYINIVSNPDYDVDLRDEIQSFAPKNSFVGTYRYGEFAFSSPSGVSQLQVLTDLNSEFIAPINPPTVLSVPAFSTFEWSGYPTIQLEGGSRYFEPIMQRVSFSAIAKKINEYSPYVKYKTYSWDEASGFTLMTENEFYLEMIPPSTIRKKSSLVPQVDSDKPEELKNEAAIGVTYTEVQSSETLRRYSGPYEPKFRDVFYFNRPKVDQIIGPNIDLSFKNATFNSAAEGFSLIKNMGLIKASEKDVLSLSKNLKYKPVYPLLNEVAIDRVDFSVIQSSWNPGFYRSYVTKDTYKPQAGTREMLEPKNFFGTKIMKTPHTLRIEGFTSRNLNEGSFNPLTSLEGIRIDQYDEEMVYIVTEKAILGVINVKKRLLRWLKEDGASKEFLRLLVPEFGTGNPDTFDDDIYEYLLLNVLPTYEVKNVDLYIKKGKTPGRAIPDAVRGDLSDAQKLLNGYSLNKSFAAQKKESLVYSFDYKLDKSFFVSLAPSIDIGRI